MCLSDISTLLIKLAKFHGSITVFQFFSLSVYINEMQCAATFQVSKNVIP